MTARRTSGRGHRHRADSLAAAVPPHSLETEQAALGAMLLDSAACEEGASQLASAHFYREAHRLVFDVYRSLRAGGRAVDLTTVTAALTATGTLDAAGGAIYIAGLLSACPTPANMASYIAVLEDFWRRRALLEAGMAFQGVAMNGGEVNIGAARALLDQVVRSQGPCSATAAGDLAVLLRDLADFMRRFLVFSSPHQVTAIALWIAHAYVYDCFPVSPYLLITAPEKACGKTRVLETLELLVRAPWRVIMPTEAVLFRKIDAAHPTLLLDEMDAVFGHTSNPTHEGLRALLNAGNRRGVRVSRCVGDGPRIEVRDFDTFTPRALAAIGSLPDTIEDRGISIRLQRKMPSETVEDPQTEAAKAAAAPLRQSLERWATGARETLRSSTSAPISGLTGRALELWWPLRAIADLAGGDWPRVVRDAAESLSTAAIGGSETVRVLLLQHIREVFVVRGVDRITTIELLSALAERDDGPWAEWWGREVAADNTRGPAAKLARRLRPFGIASKSVRLHDGTTPKGYVRADFEDAFRRYLPFIPVESRHNATTLDTQGLEAHLEDATDPSCGDMETARQALQDKACGVVATSNSQEGAGRGKGASGDDEGRRAWLRALYPERTAWIDSATPAEIAAAANQAELEEGA